MAKAVKPVSGVSLKRQLIFWLCALVVFIAVFWLLSDVLLPFIVAMGLAYLLDPLVQRLQRLGINRTFATIIILLVAVALIALALILLIPALGSQFAAFMERLPGYVDKVEQLVKAQSHTWLGQLAAEKLPEAQKSLSGFAGQAASWAAGLLGSILAGGRALLSALSLIVLAPVIAFFLLLDWDRMVAKIDDWVPRAASRHRARAVARNGQRDREFPARAGAELPDPRHLLCRQPQHHRPEFRLADRPRLRHC